MSPDHSSNVHASVPGLPESRDWYRTRAYPGQITRINEKHIHPFWAGTIWVVHGRDLDLVIDTGTGIVAPEPLISKLGGKPLLAVALCDYYDHAGGLYSFEQRACHVLEADSISTPGSGRVDPDTRQALSRFVRRVTDSNATGYQMTSTTATRLLQDGDIISLGDRSLEVLHIPGRTPGSVALFEDETGFLFTGESLFDDPEQNDFPPQDPKLYERSLARLAELPVSMVFGGHFGSFSANRFRHLVACESGRYS